MRNYEIEIDELKAENELLRRALLGIIDILDNSSELKIFYKTGNSVTCSQLETIDILKREGFTENFRFEGYVLSEQSKKSLKNLSDELR